MLLMPCFLALFMVWVAKSIISFIKTKLFHMNFRKVFESLKENGGASYGLFNFELNPSEGYMVACAAERIYDQPTSYYDFKALVADYLANVPFPDSYELEDVFLGFWTNPEGRLVIDFAEIIAGIEDAKTVGRERKQLAIFDNASKNDITL